MPSHCKSLHGFMSPAQLVEIEMINSHGRRERKRMRYKR